MKLEEFPRSICLYDQPYEQVRISWTPADFFRRVHNWFSATALGNLHAEDQPLEPLVSTSNYKLILPGDFEAAKVASEPRPVSIFRVGSASETHVFRAYWKADDSKGSMDSVIAPCFCQPQTHGVIRHVPQNLRDLNALCLAGGLDLVAHLRELIKRWFVDKPFAYVMDLKLVILLYLPKKRRESEAVESTEVRAFLTFRTVKDLGIRLGVLQQHGNIPGLVFPATNPVPEVLEQIEIGVVQVLHTLTRQAAAAMNDTAFVDDKIIGVGVGALGSQIFNNLMRAGYGKWTLIDDDWLLPHNCARHYLGDWAVGQRKAEAMKDIGNAVFDDASLVDAIPANILRPDNNHEKIAASMAEAKILLDMSASIPVCRHLSDRSNIPRIISAFVSPHGKSLVVTAEDRERSIKSDWLEMLHYRAILNITALADSFQTKDGRYRYGNSCRDITTRLPQDAIAIWAGLASKVIKPLASNAGAALKIFNESPDGAIQAHSPEVSPPIRCSAGDWTLQFDHWVLEKMGTIREQRLPNETGGVLLGNFDTERRVCSIIDVLPSPPDSKEWPTTYIRGCEGLAENVKRIQEQTLGQVNYAGEWHSHPRDCSTQPSNDDRKAYGWLVGLMRLDSLPAIMVIIGDDHRFHIVSTETEPN
ncbi:MAG TPA: ThiF family adenylyltransferase [Verrucomicrobiae bacterium]|nr:ThiF family adenylyltransferase [Verrucomicrobiae bacterium]